MGFNEFYPKEENLGHNCEFWAIGGAVISCCFPKLSMNGRTSCRGRIDEECLYLKDGRPPASLTQERITELKLRVPGSDYKDHIPPVDAA